MPEKVYSKACGIYNIPKDIECYILDSRLYSCKVIVVSSLGYRADVKGSRGLFK